MALAVWLGLTETICHGKGSGESIYMLLGSLQARGKPLSEAMHPRSTERNSGPQRPS